MLKKKLLFALFFLLGFLALVFCQQEKSIMINTPLTFQLVSSNEMNLKQPSTTSEESWESWEIEWNNVFLSLETLENNLTFSMETINTLIINLESLNNQWWLMSERMEKNDYYILDLEEENKNLTSKNKSKVKWIIGGTLGGVTLGFTAGLFVGFIIH